MVCFPSGISKAPLRPVIVNSIVFKCGSAINVTWGPPSPKAFITEFEIILKSTSEEEPRQSANLSSTVMSHEFVGLRSNQFYEVYLRARNSDGFSPWATIQITTTAGMIEKRMTVLSWVVTVTWFFVCFIMGLFQIQSYLFTTTRNTRFRRRQGNCRINISIAEKPKILNAQAVPLGCSAEVSWDTPSVNSCPITRYTIYYRESLTSAGVWQKTSLNVSSRNYYRLWLKCSAEHDILVMAWNKRGHNDYNGASILTVVTEKGTENVILFYFGKRENQ